MKGQSTLTQAAGETHLDNDPADKLHPAEIGVLRVMLRLGSKDLSVSAPHSILMGLRIHSVGLRD